MKLPPVNVGLIGCGAVAERLYVPALVALGREGLVAVRAVVDRDEGKARRTAAKLSGGRTAKTTSELAASDIDLAIVASPPGLHAEQSIELLAAGRSVLCEKPLATTLADGEAMLTAARSSRGALLVGLVRRHFPALRYVGEHIRVASLGRVVSVRCHEGRPFRWPVASPSYFDRTTAGGGVLIDIGTHVFDTLASWFGAPETLRYEDDAMGGVEANCRVAFGFAGGVRCEVRLSRDTFLRDRWDVEFERGTLSWDATTTDHVHHRASAGEHSVTGRAVQARGAGGAPAGDFESCFLRQLREILLAVRGVDASSRSAEAALDSLRLVLACYAERRLMPMGWLSEDERRSAEGAGSGR